MNLLTALVVALPPTLLLAATFVQARGANRATNHAEPDAPSLAHNVLTIRDDVVTVRGELYEVKADVLNIAPTVRHVAELRGEVAELRTAADAQREDSGKLLNIAGRSVIKIDALRDQLVSAGVIELGQ